MDNILSCSASTIKDKKKSKTVKKKIKYGTNIGKQIEDATSRQAKELKESGFARQFDTIMLDSNEINPVGLNQSNVMNHDGKKSYDVSLQRDIDFRNGYSEFLPTQMHYDVEDDFNMMTSNMSYHTSKRDYNIAKDNTHLLGIYTGVDPFYKSKDNFDPVNIIEPMKDLTYVNGAPSQTDFYESRYVPSIKNNDGDLPFANNMKVLPGVNGEVDPKNTVYRTIPKTTNELRSVTNPKKSYNADKIEAVKKGEYRGTTPNLTKMKKKTHRERGMDDYLPNSAAVNKRKVDGKYRKPNTHRSTSKNVVGHAHKPTKGIKTTSKYTESGKIIYANDAISRAVSNVTTKPVLQNKEAFRNIPNERTNTNHNIPGAAFDSNEGNYVMDPKDVPLVTLRQLMIDGDTNIGVTSKENKESYYFSKDNVLPTTIRETTEVNNNINNVKPDIHEGYYFNEYDSAKPTIRQNTGLAKLEGNMNPEIKEGHYFNEYDAARYTIKETTELNSSIGNVKPSINEGHYYNEYDTARQTIREGTELQKTEGNVNSYIKEGHYFNDKDKARFTIKETTENNNITAPLNPDVNESYYFNSDPAKQTVKQTTIFSKIAPILNPEVKEGHYYNDKDFARQTIKQTTTNSKVESNIQPYGGAPTLINFDSKPRQTIKETTSLLNYDSNIRREEGGSSYVYNQKHKARPTVKQTTLYSDIQKNIVDTNEGNYVRDSKDKARPTIKQSTLHSSNGHFKGETQKYAKNDDVAKTTVKETTLHEGVSNRIGRVNQDPGYARDKDDKAKSTIKETTLHSSRGGPLGNGSKEKGKTRNGEKARVTIKQTTLLQNHTGALESRVSKQINEEAARNMEIDDRREILTYNRPANRKSDYAVATIDPDGVELKEENFLVRENYGYDKSKANIGQLDKTYTRNKQILCTPNYRINEDFITTLDSNPLVNDLMHQKR